MNNRSDDSDFDSADADMGSTDDPAETILLAVTGMSPAVITETVWALAHQDDPVVPARIIAVTTLAGREEIRRRLFEPSDRFDGLAPWESLRDTLRARGLTRGGQPRFGVTGDDIRVITAVDPETGLSRELADIRTPGDNDAVADFLLDQVRAIVENPDTRLIASIAGGRKTMGALLYACLTLAGRETDRLTHVLVNEPFDTIREFFFPDQPGGAVPASAPDRRGSGEVSPSDARIELGDVPFVPLRNLFVRELNRKAGTFSRLVDSCRETIRHRAAEELRVSIDTTRCELEVNGAQIRTAPLEHLLLLFLARRRKREEPAFGAYKDAVDGINEFRVELLSAGAPDDFGDWRHADSLRDDWDDRSITKAASGLREKLRRQGGDAALLAACLPEKGRCSLDVPGSLIHIKDR